MRVIGGKYKRTVLESAEDKELRPMLDRVKESLFNIIQADVQNAIVLDIFSGSGSIGIEALSRGAEFCTFIEKNEKLAKLIQTNLDNCKITPDKANILNRNFLKLPQYARHQSPAGLVFVDPPYKMTDNVHSRTALFDVLEALIGAWIAPDAILMLHHEPTPYALWPTQQLVCYDQRIYGRSQLSFFHPGTYNTSEDMHNG